MVSELCSAQCASVRPPDRRGARAAAVARKAIAGASALLSSFEASSAVTRSSRDWMAAGGCRVHRQVSYLSVGRQSEGQLSCCDVRAVSHLSVVQDLRDVARVTGPSNMFS